MLNILAVLGWIVLALLVLIVWVILVPRSVFVEYTNADGITVKVRIAFFKIKVYPLNLPFKKKEKEKKAKGKAKSGQNKQEEKSPLAQLKEDLPKGMELVKEILSTVKGVMAIILKGLYIKDVSFNLPINAGDAYNTQKQYGTITNAFYSFNIFLQKYVKISYKSPVFIADFANLYADSTYFYCKIQASPSIILAVGWHLFKIYRDLDKKPKE